MKILAGQRRIDGNVPAAGAGRTRPKNERERSLGRAISPFLPSGSPGELIGRGTRRTNNAELLSWFRRLRNFLMIAICRSEEM